MTCPACQQPETSRSPLQPFRQFSFDRSAAKPSRVQAHKAERFYASRLIKVARQIGDLIDGVDPTSSVEVNEFAARLRRYSDILRPWATSVGARMLADVEHTDGRYWRSLSAEMGGLIRGEIEGAPAGLLMQQLLREQVGLITSIPVEAAERVQKLSVEALINGTRAKEIAAEIMRSGDVAKSRALTIARTEVSRAHTSFTEARAQQAGSEGYIWRTSRDGDVRPSHKGMAGKFVKWSSPPTLDKMTGHAGQFPNCRCWPEPVF